MAWLTIQAAITTSNAADDGSMAPAKAANAANGVAHAKARLASTQAAVRSRRQNKRAMRVSMAANKCVETAGLRSLSDSIVISFRKICSFKHGDRISFAAAVRRCRDAPPLPRRHPRDRARQARRRWRARAL